MDEARKDSVQDKVTLCDCLVHPFQDDPGTSQPQRIAEELLGGKSRIDARKTADLLDFFYQLSMQINYYDSNLLVSDWRPFFEKSAPFVLTSMIRYKGPGIRKDFQSQCLGFEKKPTKEGLQLLQLSIYYNTVQPLFNWFRNIRGSDLPIERLFEKIVMDKISGPLLNFISLNRLAAKRFSVKAIDFEDFFGNEEWRLPGPKKLAEKLKSDEDKLPKKDCELLLILHKQSQTLFQSFYDQVKVLSKAAEQSLELSFIPLSEELRKKHLPHLALMFAFIKLFQKLQGQLNGFTKKHLDHFYKEVLRLGSKGSVSDKAHIVFAIQKELDKYRVEKGVLLRDGRDINKEDILFSLDDEIVVNQAQVKEIRTLHLNHLLLPPPKDQVSRELQAVVEGVYMATDATKADGIDKEFQSEVKNFYTLGHKESKYALPETKVIKPYETARLGFVLASPILFLEGGTRKVTITLECEHDIEVCKKKNEIDNPPSKKCCEEPANGVPVAAKLLHRPIFPTVLLFKQPVKLFKPQLSIIREIRPIAVRDVIISDEKSEKDKPEEIAEKKTTASALPQNVDDMIEKVNNLINEEYYYINQDLVTTAVKKGLGSKEAKLLRDFLSTSNEKPGAGVNKSYCYCPNVEEGFDAVVEKEAFETKMGNSLKLVQVFFKKRKPFSLLFSGEKEWISPSEDNNTSTKFTITRSADANKFTFEIVATLNSDKDPVVFFNSANLKEDLETDLPLVKIELDDHVKLAHHHVPDNDGCCLDRKLEEGELPFSFYHFFRDVKLLRETKIDVKVCGLKKMVVKNDESTMDVNAPIFPFGARPDIANFSVISVPDTNCITLDLIAEADAKLTANGRYHLHKLVDDAPGRKVPVKKDKIGDFLSTKFQHPDHEFTDDEKKILSDLLLNPSKNYCAESASGPSFYIGSNEVWRKKWNEASINIQWKDKPGNFNEYYKAYYVKPGDPSIFGLNEDDFRMNVGVLQENSWQNELKHPPPPPPAVNTIPYNSFNNRPLFRDDSANSVCGGKQTGVQKIYLKNDFFDIQRVFTVKNEDLPVLNVNTRDGFVRVNLQNQDFLHSDYSFVLARQMVAFGKLPKEHVEGAIYYDTVNPGTGPIVISTTDMVDAVKNAAWIAEDVNEDVVTVNTAVKVSNDGDPIDAHEATVIRNALDQPPTQNPPSEPAGINLVDGAQELDDLFHKPNVGVIATLERLKKYAAIIPNEPWTPAISGISIDYTATAVSEDINLVHLYPFKNTRKAEKIEFKPTLLPTFCDVGYLFLGLEKLVPGTNLNILFQLAEATADSEEEKEQVNWYYLDNDIWKPLRTRFEVVEDGTLNLTTTGVIKFALPENMTNGNSIMPAGLHWIRASIPKNSRSVSETIGVHTQAVRATFTNSPANDKLRLGKPIEAEQINKLEVADASIKQLKQPYETFGGKIPEEQGMYYVRVSEMLRHKGRAIQKFDYERIVLDAFPEIFRAKCINHSFGLNANLYEDDFPYAPGYVIVAVIPDLLKMKAGNSYEPKVPVSILEKINEHVRRRVSPFVRFRSVNPRYEKIHLCLKVKLVKGKDEDYYKEKLQEDVRKLLAPWEVGAQYLFKLAFGACVNRSTIIGFIESLDYIDFIGELRMRHESQEDYDADSAEKTEVCPGTPRSILIGGDIEVCIIEEYCEEWGKCTDQDRTKCCDKLETVTDLCKPDTKRKGAVS